MLSKDPFFLFPSFFLLAGEKLPCLKLQPVILLTGSHPNIKILLKLPASCYHQVIPGYISCL